MTPLDLVILVFGVYRWYMLIAKDTLTERWRTRFLGYDDTGSRNRWPNPHPRIGAFVHCPWCLGFWFSLVAVLAYSQWPHGTRWVLLPFAVSSLVALAAVTFDRVVLDRS